MKEEKVAEGSGPLQGPLRCGMVWRDSLQPCETKLSPSSLLWPSPWSTGHLYPLELMTDICLSVPCAHHLADGSGAVTALPLICRG